MNKFDWTEDNLTTLKTLWAMPDMTSGKIAKAMGTSRGSVMGKLNRLGLIGPSTKERACDDAPALAIAKPEPVAAAPEIPADPMPSHGHRPLIDLRSNECRWPMGELMDRPGLFCGAPATHPRYDYCECHAKKAFYRWPPGSQGQKR